MIRAVHAVEARVADEVVEPGLLLRQAEADAQALSQCKPCAEARDSDAEACLRTLASPDNVSPMHATQYVCNVEMHLQLTSIAQDGEGQLVRQLAGKIVVWQLAADGDEIGAESLLEHGQAVAQVPQRQVAQGTPRPAVFQTPCQLGFDSTWTPPSQQPEQRSTQATPLGPHKVGDACSAQAGSANDIAIHSFQQRMTAVRNGVYPLKKTTISGPRRSRVRRSTSWPLLSCRL